MSAVHFSLVLTNVATSPASGVRNYLKEALVNIISVHAEVERTNQQTRARPVSWGCVADQLLCLSGLHRLQGPGAAGPVQDRGVGGGRDVPPHAVRVVLQQERSPAGKCGIHTVSSDQSSSPTQTLSHKETLRLGRGFHPALLLTAGG